MEVYKEQGITLLRLEASMSEGDPKFPPFIKIAKEVTEDPMYSTNSMSKKP
jgi:CYTH domain-containing protein